MKTNDIKTFSSTAELFQFAAEDFKERASNAVQEKGFFSVVLSGGNTPKAFFDVLTATAGIPWRQIKFFFGDERYVPAESEESNYHMAEQHLFAKVPVNPKFIYRMPTEFDDPTEAASAYEKTLREAFAVTDNDFPPFDLLYLGLGDNAHTASLMPQSDVVKFYSAADTAKNSTRLVAALFVPELNMYRLTLTPPAINHGENIIFLVTGESKATAVWEVLEGKPDPLNYPAQLIHSIHGQTIWYFDKPAASRLGSNHDN